MFGCRTAINSPDPGLTSHHLHLRPRRQSDGEADANLAAGGQQVTLGYQFNRVTSITYPNFAMADDAESALTRPIYFAMAPISDTSQSRSGFFGALAISATSVASACGPGSRISSSMCSIVSKL